MRHFTNLPPNYGSRRFERCPPSHHEMVLTPYYAQASARAPRPSPPLTHSPVSSAKVSPYQHRGSNSPLAAPSVPLAGGCPPNPSGRLDGLMAPSPTTTGAATPSASSARTSLLARSSPTHPLPTMGGSATLAARRALSCSQQRLAFAMSTHPGFADKNPWVMEVFNAVAHELQFWY